MAFGPIVQLETAQDEKIRTTRMRESSRREGGVVVVVEEEGV